MANIGGIFRLWDQTEEVRDRARAHGQLIMRSPHESMQAICQKSAQHARLNKSVLLPVLDAMASSDLKLPAIPVLLVEVSQFFTVNSVADVDGRLSYCTNWGMRKLLQLVKARLYKVFPPPPEECSIIGQQHS